jgi:hypothetical protein
MIRKPCSFLDCVILVTLIVSSSNLLATPISETQAKAFVERFIALGENYDEALADLYLDESEISAVRKTSPTQSQSLKFEGKRYKAIVRAAMPSAKAQGDRSSLSNFRYVAESGAMRIRADRYSHMRCYQDKSFELLITRTTDGRLGILRQHTETQTWSECTKPL